MMQLATLIRLQYSPLPPLLEGIRSATTEEWKRSNAEGQFDLIPSLHFRGFHRTLNMLILSEGADKGKVGLIPAEFGYKRIMKYVDTKKKKKSVP